MIILDFLLIDALGFLRPDELAFLDENRIATDLFECHLTFKVNSVDLSWHAPIPMVDFARSMFMAACGLSAPDHTVQVFFSVELEPSWTFRLHGSHVSISRDDLPDRAECEQAELVRATGDFGARVYDACLKALPAAANNTFLLNWYPVAEMRRAANGQIGFAE